MAQRLRDVGLATVALVVVTVGLVLVVGAFAIIALHPDRGESLRALDPYLPSWLLWAGLAIIATAVVVGWVRFLRRGL